MPANPVNQYDSTPVPYHSINTAKYNKSVLVSANFIATGSFANPAAFAISGSALATVTLINGGTFTAPAPAAASPMTIYEMGVYSVTAGSVYLLYR